MNRRKLFGLGLGVLAAPLLPVLAPVPAFARGGVIPNVGAPLIGETIDASRIITGTISADRIQASSILAEKLRLPVRSTFADQIVDGSISISRISGDHIASLEGTPSGLAASEPVCEVPDNAFSGVTVRAEATGDREGLS